MRQGDPECPLVLSQFEQVEQPSRVGIEFTIRDGVCLHSARSAGGFNVARIMQKMYDNEIRVYDERLRQEKEMYPSQKQFIPGWLKKWRISAIPQRAIQEGFDQEDWDGMSESEKKVFLND